MKANNIYYGNIMKCDVKQHILDSTYNTFLTNVNKKNFSIDKNGRTIYTEYRPIPYKSNVILIKIGTDKFIALPDIENELDYFKILISNIKLNLDLNLILTTKPRNRYSLYVDEKTLKPYYKNCTKQQKVKVKQLKLDNFLNKHKDY